jgi:hypothetical protein
VAEPDAQADADCVTESDDDAVELRDADVDTEPEGDVDGLPLTVDEIDDVIDIDDESQYDALGDEDVHTVCDGVMEAELDEEPETE